MSDPEILKSIEEFLFGAPLYKKYRLPEDMKFLKIIYGQADDVTVDGHCPKCGRDSTFRVPGVYLSNSEERKNISLRYSFDTMNIICVRSKGHWVRYDFYITKMILQKIGQYPSLADISNDEVAQYRKGMADEDAREFHKAIGLAAHGVGVGSFVYLRRVFERLIYGRFEEFKDTEEWKEEAFLKSSMVDKIRLMKNHLPPFLVENAKIYSILSIGIHELDEKECLGYFDLMKQSIIIILEEDKKKREELALKRSFTETISKFSPPVQS